MNDIGLVFEGGGGRGAYQIGVWKYLKERGIDKKVKVVSGTSVGALNASLFVGSDYDRAEEMWRNIEPGQILTPKKVKIKQIVKWIENNGFDTKRFKDKDFIKDYNSFLKRFAPIVPSTAVNLSGIGTEAMALLMEKYLFHDHMFSREGIISLMHKSLEFDKMNNSDIPCIVTTLKIPDFIPQRHYLNNLNEEDIIKLLLASSAIPIIFPSEVYNGNRYVDGGLPIVGDNIPVRPAYNVGVDTIIVVRLSQLGRIDRRRFPKSKIIEVIPSKDLGNAITGLLDFTAYGASKRMELGYNDAFRLLCNTDI